MTSTSFFHEMPTIERLFRNSRRPPWHVLWIVLLLLPLTSGWRVASALSSAAFSYHGLNGFSKKCGAATTPTNRWILSNKLLASSTIGHQYLRLQSPVSKAESKGSSAQLSSIPIDDVVTNNFNHKINEVHSEDSIERFSSDVTKVLRELRPAVLDESVPAIFYSKSLTFTRLWNLEDWDKHSSRWRYVRYLTGLPTSRLLRRTLPQLAVLTIWSTIAVALRNSRKQWAVLDIPLTSISLISSFVAALLTLRSNQSLSRLSDCQAAFGKALLYTRDMAQLIASSVYPKNKQIAMIMIRHLSLFVWLLKSHLRETRNDDKDIVQTMLPDHPDDVSYILKHRKTPLAILSKLRQCISHLADEHPHILHMADHLELEHHVVELNHVIMTTERIRSSPVPPLYTSHTGRLLMVNLFILPLALLSTATGGISTVVTTVLVGFAMCGLDEISHTFEQPFRLMPLYQISKVAMLDVSDAITCCAPPPLSLSPKTSASSSSTTAWTTSSANGNSLPFLPVVAEI